MHDFCGINYIKLNLYFCFPIYDTIMKKILLVLVIVSGIAFSAQGQIADLKVKWYTLKDALELQKKQPKKILIDIYTDWCGWCKKMDAETFNHPVIAQYLNQYFYPVKFDAESKDSVIFANHKFINENKGSRSTHQFAMALFQAQNVQVGYPSIAYLDENLQLIRVWEGFWTAPQIEVWLHYVVDEKYKPLPLEEYQKTFVSKIKQ
jgi:thioredoxin-related protein